MAKYPKAIGPYSPYFKAGKLYFLSGQIGIIPKTGEIIEGGIEKEADQVCKNIGGVLDELNLDFSHVVKTTIFVKNIGDFGIVNEIYGKYFVHKPARSTVEVSNLPKNALIEIECVARKD